MTYFEIGIGNLTKITSAFHLHPPRLCDDTISRNRYSLHGFCLLCTWLYLSILTTPSKEIEIQRTSFPHFRSLHASERIFSTGNRLQYLYKRYQWGEKRNASSKQQVRIEPSPCRKRLHPNQFVQSSSRFSKNHNQNHLTVKRTTVRNRSTLEACLRKIGFYRRF